MICSHSNLNHTGRGIFAARAIAAGAIVETCPVLILPPKDVPATETTILNHFSYNWPYQDHDGARRGTTQAVALGLGSIFNHSNFPNVGFRKDLDRETITYTALRDIESGEELCINYGPKLWFKDVEENEGNESEEDDTTILSRIELDRQ